MSTVLAPAEPVAAPGPAAVPAPAGRGIAAWLVRWRLALRMARRDARRAKGRTVLVLLMVGLPVLAIVGGDTIFRTNELSAVEALPSRLGAADARIEGVARGPIYADPVEGYALEYPGEADPPWTADEIAAELPAGAEVAEQQVGALAFRTPVGYASAEGYAEDLRRSIRAGAYDLVDGRVPSRDGEVAVTTAIARRGIAVGDTMLLTRDDVPATVVGVLRPTGDSGLGALVVAPEAVDLLTGPRPVVFASIAGGVPWSMVQQLNERGLLVVSREVVLDPPPPAAYVPPGYPTDGAALDPAQVAVLALVVAALVLEVVLLAGPAFAVGLRRQRRDLALLAANGGTPGDLRRAVLASGLLLGAGAAVLGALLGIGLARAAVPVLENGWGAGLGPFQVPVLDVLVITLVGASAGLAAAWVPARQAARTDVVTTLSGRRGQVRSSWRLPVLGLVVTAVGVGLAVVGAQGQELAVAGGAVVLVVGVVLATPWLVGLLGPLARKLPVAGRLAVRDATRNRTRTAPAVAAVMATVAGLTALAIGSASDSAQSRRDYVPQGALGVARISLIEADEDGWTAARRAVEQQLPGHEVTPVQGPLWTVDEQVQVVVGAAGCTGGLTDCMWMPDGVGSYSTAIGQLVVLDERALLLALTPEQQDAVAAVYRDDAVLVFGGGAVADGRVALVSSRWDGQTEQPLGEVVLPAVEVDVRATGDYVQVPAMAVVPPSLADRLPVAIGTTALLAGGPEDPVTPAEQQRVEEVVAGLSSDGSVYVERGWQDDQWVARLLLVLVGGALVLVATLTATGLAVADARPDLATLAAIGAAPRTRRFMAMGSAAVIGVFGAALGVLAGLAPGIAVAYPLTTEVYGNGGAEPLVVIPWDLLAAVAIGVPLLAVLVTGLAVRSRLPMATRLT